MNFWGIHFCMDEAKAIVAIGAMVPFVGIYINKARVWMTALWKEASNGN